MQRATENYQVHLLQTQNDKPVATLRPREPAGKASEMFDFRGMKLSFYK